MKTIASFVLLLLLESVVGAEEKPALSKQKFLMQLEADEAREIAADKGHSSVAIANNAPNLQTASLGETLYFSKPQEPTRCLEHARIRNTSPLVIVCQNYGTATAIEKKENVNSVNRFYFVGRN